MIEMIEIRERERERGQCEREKNKICVDNVIMGPTFSLRSEIFEKDFN